MHSNKHLTISDEDSRDNGNYSAIWKDSNALFVFYQNDFSLILVLAWKD